MLHWPFKKRTPPEGEAAGPGGTGGDDEAWEFLRSRPDYDRQEMASVHGVREPKEVEETRKAELPAAADHAPPGEPWVEEYATPAGPLEPVHLTEEDAALKRLLQEAMGEGPPECGAAAAPHPQIGGDLLDLALQQGEAAGLLASERAEAEAAPSDPAPEAKRS